MVCRKQCVCVSVVLVRAGWWWWGWDGGGWSNRSHVQQCVGVVGIPQPASTWLALGGGVTLRLLTCLVCVCEGQTSTIITSVRELMGGEAGFR